MFFFSSRRRHTRWPRDWSSDVCSSDLQRLKIGRALPVLEAPGHDKSPGAFIFESHRVLLVCHDGVIELTEVQPSGKKMMRATDWARGVDESIRLHTSATHPNEFDQN